MPIYMTIHTLLAGTLSRERIEELARLGQESSIVKGYRSFHSPAEGRIVWLLEAEDSDAVVSWCRDVGLPLDSVTPLELEGHVGKVLSHKKMTPNRVSGIVVRIIEDGTLRLVSVALTPDIKIMALLDAMAPGMVGIETGDRVCADIRAAEVSLMVSQEGARAMKLSFPNQIKGTVTQIISGQTLVIIHLDTPAGPIVSAIIPSAAESISIKVGDEVTALFKALDVSLAKEG